MVKRKFLTSRGDPFVTSDVLDAQNCGKTQILDRAEEPLISSLWTCRTFKTVVKRQFCVCGWQPSRDVSNAQNCGKTQNPFVLLCVSDAQNCGKMEVFDRTGLVLCSTGLVLCSTGVVLCGTE